MRKAALHNLGCKVNAYETEVMGQLLEEAGYELVPFGEEADVYIINTCSVTHMADRKSRQMIRRARKQNPAAVVVAAGCYVQSSTGEAAEKLGVDVILGNNCKSRLIRELDNFFENGQQIVDCIEINQGKALYEEMQLSRAAEHTRAFVKVQDGCNQFCSYCIIPYTRGRARSRSMEDVRREAEKLAANGYRELVLTGIHLSSYGCEGGAGLPELLECVCAVPGIERVRLGSLEPQIVTEEFVRRISRCRQLCPHFHLSLQSGCDATLRRMNRKYTTAEYRTSCQLLRKYFDHPAITTDVIVGFPGETGEEFEETCRFLQSMHFYEMHVFKYSRREGTRAARMDGQLPEEEKTRRSNLLLEMAAQESVRFRREYEGKTVGILLEEQMCIDGESYYVGFTPEYVKAAVNADGHESGSFVRGKVSGALREDLLLLVEF